MLVTKTPTRTVAGSDTVLAIGPWDRSEFGVVSQHIPENVKWVAVSNCAVALRVLAQSEVIPRYILLAQPSLGTYKQQEIEDIRAAAPLAHLVVVAGTWCEGELRTGKPLVGVRRIYWYHFATWWQFQRQHQTSWPMSLDGTFDVRSDREYSKQTLSGIAAVHTSALASFEAIAAALEPDGMECLWTSNSSKIPQNITTAIWDGAQLDPPEFAQVQNFAAAIQQRQAALVVLLDFPRKDHFISLQKLGCRSILSKPYNLNDLSAACGLANDVSPVL